jgi:UDP-N-acetylglucosamine 2-epimerase (non-hydrolysing)
MIKVMTVVGTRPEVIKMAPVIRALNRYPEDFETVVCATAQHREMLDQMLDIFDISPGHDLDLMRPEQSLSQLTARILTALDGVIVAEQPDWVLAQGDTTTVMVAGLVAFYHRIKVGHVEAGLRTEDKYQPFPEEINRRVTDVLADLHFAPTEVNRQNLIREGVPVESIVVTGNTVIDALMMMAERIDDRTIASHIGSMDGKQLILVTAHRRENFGTPLRNICRALLEIATTYRGSVHVVYPVHLNPKVRGPVYEMLGRVSNISLIDPVDYATFVGLMRSAYIILTDSGGLQEEAPSLNKPVLVLRDVTERPEATAVGAAKLVGTDCDTIVRETARLLEDRATYQEMASAENPYGDGHASERIVQAILAWGS